MVLSDWGKIVETEFLKSFEIRNELFLDEYIIMPNHLHAIVLLKKNNLDDADGLYGTDVDMHGRAYLRSNAQTRQQFVRKPKSISSFMAGFKSAVNTKIDDYMDEHNMDMPKYNRNNHFFQPNYHDRIIRNNGEYGRTKNYIKNNPGNWEKDNLKND